MKKILLWIPLFLFATLLSLAVWALFTPALVSGKLLLALTSRDIAKAFFDFLHPLQANHPSLISPMIGTIAGIIIWTGVMSLGVVMTLKRQIGEEEEIGEDMPLDAQLWLGDAATKKEKGPAESAKSSNRFQDFSHLIVKQEGGKTDAPSEDAQGGEEEKEAKAETQSPAMNKPAWSSQKAEAEAEAPSASSKFKVGNFSWAKPKEETENPASETPAEGQESGENQAPPESAFSSPPAQEAAKENEKTSWNLPTQADSVKTQVGAENETAPDTPTKEDLPAGDADNPANGEAPSEGTPGVSTTPAHENTHEESSTSWLQVNFTPVTQTPQSTQKSTPQSAKATNSANTKATETTRDQQIQNNLTPVMEHVPTAQGAISMTAPPATWSSPVGQQVTPSPAQSETNITPPDTQAGQDMQAKLNALEKNLDALEKSQKQLADEVAVLATRLEDLLGQNADTDPSSLAEKIRKGRQGEYQDKLDAIRSILG